MLKKEILEIGKNSQDEKIKGKKKWRIQAIFIIYEKLKSVVIFNKFKFYFFLFNKVVEFLKIIPELKN